jgi:hypothetical protein
LKMVWYPWEMEKMDVSGVYPSSASMGLYTPKTSIFFISHGYQTIFKPGSWYCIQQSPFFVNLNNFDDDNDGVGNDCDYKYNYDSNDTNKKCK